MIWWVLVGCNPDTSALQKELAETQNEVQVLRARLNQLEEKAKPTEPSVVSTPSGGSGGPLLVDEVERARRRAVEQNAAQATEELADAVDEDLATLEDDVDAQADQLEAINDAIDELTEIVNNHADLLDGLGEDILSLDKDVQIARELEPVLSVEDGQLRVRDVNLVLEQGLDAEGEPLPNGRILTRPAAVPGE